MTARILVVDDEPRIVEAVCRLLRLEGYEAEPAHDGVAALEVLRGGGFSAVLLDLDMPRKDGMTALRELRGRGDETPVIIVSGRGSIARAVEATRLGAHDFVEKPVDDERLLLSLRRAIEYRSLSDEVEAARAERGERTVVAESRSMKETLAAIPRIATAGSTVLLTGETGTGKEIVAHMIHAASPRSRAPFVKVNCAALPEALAESELFGHVKGAFTGAVKERKGRFQLSDGGTLFLDEVGELPLSLQAKLLRALGEGEFEPVGSERTCKADVRIIAATNRDLETEVKEGRFRSDLYYRMAIIRLHLPPLRERREDVAALVDFFLAAHRRKFSRPDLALSPSALERLQRYDWPGNVRELQNMIERLAVLSPDDLITDATVAGVLPALAASVPGGGRLADALAAEEGRLLREAIKSADGNVAAAARLLGLERSHLYKKLKRHGIEP